ncbi:hypothetical protein [Deinococcus arcticus]|uniref:Uncharacterized protein n=1 Tax=Deinococcus arcticus TaxID=2136176 RepID=A0A2T3WB13_9DEIO|nr:hypothetical protein [Deinococcus arcticus]PTA68994.1 hypothetical protein C8263_04130 [Deinococcus arcticus]
MSGEEKALSGHAYALAWALTRCEDAAPLSVRAVWASFLRRSEPCPAAVRRGALEAHERGQMRAGRLTGSGVRAALEVLGGAQSPPVLYVPPVGPVVTHGKS